MGARLTSLECAFDLAHSGKCLNVGEIRRHLKSEGYSVKKLEGRSLTRQLVVLIEKAAEPQA